MARMFMSANEMQDKLGSVVNELNTEENQTCFITSEGQTKAVLVDIDRYNAMMDALEAADDLDPSDRNLIEAILGKTRPN